jgi:hypothetical protein
MLTTSDGKELRRLGLTLLWPLLTGAKLAEPFVSVGASAKGADFMTHAAASIAPTTATATAVLERYGVVSASSIASSSLLDGDDGAARVAWEAQRVLFSAPTAHPTAAVTCQAGDEASDADLGCSFDDAADNDG